MNRPNFSNAYEHPQIFYVVSYLEHDDNRELIDKTFTTEQKAREWVENHENGFENLKVHTAALEGEVVTFTTPYDD